MSSRTSNILKALFFALLTVIMVSLMFSGSIDTEAGWPVITAAIFAVLTVIYLKQAFSR